MGQKFSNNAIATLKYSSSASNTTFTVETGEGDKFPVLNTGDWFMATVIRKSDGAIEIIKVKDHIGDNFSLIDRGQEGTVPLDFVAGDTIELRLTRGSLEQLQSDINSNKLPSKTGNSLKYLRVNSTETGYEWGSIDLSLYLLNSYFLLDTGNARGNYSVDITRYRQDASYVVSGDKSTGVGYNNKVEANYASVFGYHNTVGLNATFSNCFGYYNFVNGSSQSCIGYSNVCNVDSVQGAAVGFLNNVSSLRSVSFGASNRINMNSDYASIFGVNSSILDDSEYSVSLGSNSKVVGVRRITNINPPIANLSGGFRNYDIEFSSDRTWRNSSGVEVVLIPNTVSFLIAQSHRLILPANVVFFPNEVGFIVTDSANVTVLPTVSFGITGNNTLLSAAAQATCSGARHSRERRTSLLSYDGIENTHPDAVNNGGIGLVMRITVPATADCFLGRMYFKGMLVQRPPYSYWYGEGEYICYSSSGSGAALLNKPRNGVASGSGSATGSASGGYPW